MQSIEEERLKKAFVETYYAKEAADAHTLSAAKVMSHIRRLGPKTNFLAQFESLVWRFAPVVCILIVALAVCMMRIDFVSEHEINTILINDPVEFFLIEDSVI
jgi:hypothetical protein